MRGNVNSTPGAVHYVLGYVLLLLWGENTILFYFFLYLFFFPLLPRQEKHLILTEQALQDSRAISTSCTWEYSPLCTHSHRSLHPAVAQTAPRGNAEPLSANQTLITAGWASSPPSTSLYMQDTSVAITDPIRTGADTTMDFFSPQTSICNSLTGFIFLKDQQFWVGSESALLLKFWLIKIFPTFHYCYFY